MIPSLGLNICACIKLLYELITFMLTIIDIYEYKFTLCIKRIESIYLYTRDITSIDILLFLLLETDYLISYYTFRIELVISLRRLKL